MKCYSTLCFFFQTENLSVFHKVAGIPQKHTLGGEVTSDCIRKHIMRNSSLIPEWMKRHSFMDALLIKHTHVRTHMANNLKIHPDFNLKVKIPKGFNPFTLCGYLEQVSANMVMTIFKTSSCGRGSKQEMLKPANSQFSLQKAAKCKEPEDMEMSWWRIMNLNVALSTNPRGTHICNCCKSLQNYVH